jgi:hypothetical protein
LIDQVLIFTPYVHLIFSLPSNRILSFIRQFWGIPQYQRFRNQLVNTLFQQKKSSFNPRLPSVISIKAVLIEKTPLSNAVLAGN